MLNNGTTDLENGRGKKRTYDDSITNSSNVITKYRKHENSHHQDTAGVIKKIRLENFMNHGELEWEPHSNVHFVTGANGSGKSSVLQAIVLGLGGDPKHIGRYSKPKEFIRKDCNKAVIATTLANTGDNAFKPEEYGETITIQRTITESNSSYTIKGAKQRDAPVAKKAKEVRDEIKRMLDKFQIQVDSPIVILHQEVAKEMLKVESPKALYSFYEKATLIDACMTEFNEATLEFNRAKQNWKEKQKHFIHSKNEFKEVKNRYDKSQENIRMNKEYQTVKGELCWAKVHEIRELIAKNEADLEEKKKQLTKQAEVLSTVTGECKRLELNVDEINAQMDEEKAKYHKQEQEMDKIKEQIESLKANKKDLDAELRKKGGESNTLVKEKKFLTTEIDRLSGASSLEEKDRKEQERQHRLDTLFKKKNELDEKIKIEGTTREYQDAGIREESEKIKSLMIDHNEISQAIEDKLREISSLKHQPPILAMFGNKIPQLDREIKMMEKEFNKMPIGPVGQYVKLEGEAGVNGQLGKLIETELTRSHLTAYLTDNDRDRRVLQQIMDRVYGSDKRGKPRIFTSRFIGRRHENLNRPDRQSYRVVLDYLKIEDNNVFNHLVDQKSIEMVLVCKTQDEAKRLMSRVSDVPKNVMYTITYDMYRFFPAKTSSSYRSYFMDSFTGNGLLKATMKSHIQDMNSELELLKAQLDEKNRDITNSKNSRKSFECEKTRAMQQIVLYRKQLQQCSSEISKVKSEEDTDTSDLESYKMKLKTKEEQLEKIKRSIEIKKEEKNKINEQIKGLESNLMSMKNELFSQQDNEMNDKLSKSLVEKNQQLRNKTTEKKNKEKIVDRLKTQIEATEQKMRKNREQEDQYKVAAIKLIPDEIKPKKSSTDLNARAVNLKKRLQNDEDPNIESIVTEYEEFNRRLLQYKNEIDKVEGMIKTLHEMKKDREDRMIMIKNTLDTLVKRKFNSMIKKFSTNLGSQIFLRIDHKTKKLFFAFKKGDQTYKSSDHVSTLSGGEKSYTQMCLICSLWDIMEPPFRCLDEWDVFLDAVNRKAISQELLTFSLKNPNKQFIFISPQGACDLQNLPHNKVLVTEFKKNSS